MTYPDYDVYWRDRLHDTKRGRGSKYREIFFIFLKIAGGLLVAGAVIATVPLVSFLTGSDTISFWYGFSLFMLAICVVAAYVTYDVRNM